LSIKHFDLRESSVNTVGQPMTKTDAAYHEVRLAIESGKLQPGSRLLIADLEELLGMSPTPIREALRLLQRDGLVEHTPHYGTVVASFTDGEALAENHRIRRALEPLATELAAERATPQELARIRKIHEQFKRAVALEAAGRKAPRLNAEWHAAIYAASHSPQLIEFIDRLWTLRGRTKWISTHSPRSVSEHEQVLKQLEARNAAEAGRLMREHLGSVESTHEDLLLKLAAQNAS
jgi:DNA-binding GntR family transcriptional regulator